MNQQRSVTGLILSRQWHDRDDGQSLVYWLSTDQGPVRAEVVQQESIFFIGSEDLPRVKKLLDPQLQWRYEALSLKTFHHGQQPVLGCYFVSQRELGIARSLLDDAGVRCFEADIRPTDRFLMERFVKGTAEVAGEPVAEDGYHNFMSPRFKPASYSPSLTVASLDIETSITHKHVLSIAVHIVSEKREEVRKVFMIGSGAAPLPYLEYVADEPALLSRFQAWFAAEDPDVVIGWSIVGFDLRYLQDRCDVHGMPFNFGRGKAPISWRVVERGSERVYAVVPGRVVLDGIELLRTATYSFESFSLENVARELLGRGKLVHDVDARAFEIEQMFEDDKQSLAEYNLEDCVLVSEIFAETNLLEFAIERSQLTGLEMERQGGSVAAFDFLYLPRLHREGFVAPVVEDASQAGGPGGYVLDSEAGLFNDVIVMDFKSLYPSIIRTFLVDPLAMVAGDDARVPGFLDASFSKRRNLLPRIIEELWSARDAAKKAKRGAESQAIKIIMNSFYGVLGTPGCRFFDPRLVSSITLRGHEILTTTRDLIEAQGYKVIYGDTDSVFVLMNPGDDVAASGSALVQHMNTWWRNHLAESYDIESFLELEFETHFTRFLMPRIRGSEKGSKKRYAGMIAGTNELVFKGLESVRSDWTPLAREFQQELYRRLFHDEPLDTYIRDVVETVRSGECDDKLVLRRRLRRSLSDYTKNVPPHVRAARTAEEIRAARGLAPAYKHGGWIEYVMTVAGPEPQRYSESAFDYDFYIDRQLAPIADAVLVFRDTSLASITDKQLDLF